ncbi:uncharacterized protein FIBRA_06495 [Fibroporia radiculosa]|uniref:Uncharacterized protein n=1 Tax=Fibroporia radiculosa TaxID=599839 RepID=J4H439_9APHY|nr:uncharacterized protein FIBRA_06495 [Fibroporia radiculosa]CCM04324.1 predicted protein [Fibroporia radiculosa]
MPPTKARGNTLRLWTMWFRKHAWRYMPLVQERSREASPASVLPTTETRQRSSVVERGAKRTIDTTAGVSSRLVASQVSGSIVRRRHRYAAVYSATDIVATAAKDPDAHSFIHELANILGKGDQANDARRPLLLDSTPAPSLASVDIVRKPAISPIEAPLPLTTNALSQRMLRHKQRMVIMRQRSSRSLRKRSSQSFSNVSARRSEHNTTVIMQTAIVPSTEPAKTTIAYVPLGHPQRPLYTAIRKNMSPPVPVDFVPTLDYTSFSAAVQTRESKSLDIPRSTTLGRSFGRHTPIPASEWTTGCSLSGETELRITLARCRSADDDISDRFVCPKKGGVVREKVKSLGKGLKGLFLGKAG